MNIRPLILPGIGLLALIGLGLWMLQERGEDQRSLAAPIGSQGAVVASGEDLEVLQARRVEAPGSLAVPVEEPASVTTPITALAVEEALESSGLAALEMRAVDRSTGRPVASKVELWQLGLPQDSKYEAGNHLRGSIELPSGGGRLENLPPGRYRALVFCRARSTEDPPEFVLHAGLNEMDFLIETPTHERWWARIVDEFGRPLQEAGERATAYYTHAQSVDYAVQRSLLGEETFSGFGGGGGSAGIHRERTAKPAGFDLGVWREPTAGQSVTRYPRFDFDGRFDVDCRAKGWVCSRLRKLDVDALPERHFVSVSLPLNYFDASFCDHLGNPVQRDLVQVKVKASLVEVEPGAPIPLDRLHVSVSARWRGGNWTTWGHQVADGPPSDLRLSPRE